MQTKSILLPKGNFQRQKTRAKIVKDQKTKTPKDDKVYCLNYTEHLRKMKMKVRISSNVFHKILDLFFIIFSKIIIWNQNLIH